MSALPYLVLLFGFGGLVSGAVSSPTPNPECPGMHRIARSLEKGLKTYTRETTICRVNSACTGLMCNGTHKQNDFYMKMELKHCKTPPTIHLDLVYKKIKVHQEMQDGQIKISSKKTPLGTVPIELKLTLKKNRNRITTGLEVQVCPLGTCKSLATLLPPTTFCLNMKTCPGYNSTGDVPCHLNPSGNPMSTMTSTRSPHSSGPLHTTTKQSSSTRPRTFSPTQHSELMTTVSTKEVPAKQSSSTLRLSTIKPTQHSEPTKLVPTRRPIRTSRSSIKPSTKHATGPLHTTTKQSSSTRPRTFSPTQHSELMTTVSTKEVPAKQSSSTLRLSTIKPTQHSEPTKLVPTRRPIRTSRSSIKPSTKHATGPLHTTTKQSSSTRPRTFSPTQHSELMTTVSTKEVPAKQSSSTLRLSTIKPTQHSEPTKLVSTRRPIRTSRSSIKPSTKHATGRTTVQPGDTHALKRESGHHHISVGVAIGIGIACIVAILIIAGAAFYWKKFYRRSRLRAAYYNDISMNYPLYEDFGPEVA